MNNAVKLINNAEVAANSVYNAKLTSNCWKVFVFASKVNVIIKNSILISDITMIIGLLNVAV